ncbi:MAG: DUF1080 domain-containing protein [Planctomycetota bacterium]
MKPFPTLDQPCGHIVVIFLLLASLVRTTKSQETVAETTPAVDRARTFSPDQRLTMVERPRDAIVLLDAMTLAFRSKRGTEPDWKIETGCLVSTRGEERSNHLVSRMFFRDADIHIEFMTNADGSGNSGIYLHGLYEIQILNARPGQQQTQKDLGALYGFEAPAVAAGKPPGQWQVLDIRYIAPRRDDKGDLVEKGAVTVWLNGQRVHHATRFGEQRSKYNPYVYRTTAYLQEVWAYQQQNSVGPLFLQDHDNPVRFRNIWIRPLDDRAMDYPLKAATEGGAK